MPSHFMPARGQPFRHLAVHPVFPDGLVGLLGTAPPTMLLDFASQHVYA